MCQIRLNSFGMLSIKEVADALDLMILLTFCFAKQAARKIEHTVSPTD